MGEITLDSPLGLELLFTSDRFIRGSYLWKDGNYIIISFIGSKTSGVGYLSDLFKRIESKGWGCKVPTPFARMKEIIIKKGFKATIEPFAPEQGIMDPCEIWVKSPPNNQKDGFD